MTTVFSTEYARAPSAPPLARRSVESRGHVVTTLNQAWTTTLQIAQAQGIGWRRARKLLERLHAAGLVEHAIRGDGAHLWRLPAGDRR